MKFIPRRKSYDPKWVGDFLKQGAFAFTKESFELLDAIRKKYSGEWIAYLGVVRDSLKGPAGMRVRPRFAEIDRRISSLQDRMRNVATYIGRIIDYLETPTEQEVKDLFQEIKAIEQEYADIIRIGEENKEFQQILENLRMETGLDLRSLAIAHRLVEGRLRALKTERPPGFLRTAVWESTTFARFREMLWGLAGPIGIAARVVVGKYREWKRERREAIARRRWEEEYPEIARIAPYLPEEVLEAYLRERAPVRIRGMPGGERIRRGREREPEVKVGGARIRMEELPPEVQKFLREQMAEVSKGTEEMRAERARERRIGEATRVGRIEVGRGVGRMIETGGVVTALYQFFDKDAYKARWTTEIMEILKGVRRSGGRGIGIGGVLQRLTGWLRNLFPTIIAFISKLLPVILPIILVGLSALAGWFIGRFIGQKIEQWTERRRVRRELRRRAEEIRREGGKPELARALELQAQGMSVRESIIQAKRELGQPISEIYLRPIERRLEPVPVAETDLAEVFKEGNEKIARELSKLAELYEKKISVPIPETKGRLSDVRNIGDPFLEDLDRGL